MQYVRALCPTLPTPLEQPESDTATCNLPLPACHCTLSTFQHVPGDFAISKIAYMKKETSVCLLFLKQMSGQLALIFLAVGMAFPCHSDVIRLYKSLILLCRHHPLSGPVGVSSQLGAHQPGR